MGKSYPEILVLRHGETEWNAIHRMQGRLNSPLTAKGHQQAADQHATLSGQDLSGFRFFASPQGRAFQTAAIALSGLADHIETTDALCEIDMDIWAGKTLDQVFAQMGVDPADHRPFDIYNWIPGGEKLPGLFLRCQQFLENLEAPAVLVTHGVTSRCLRLIAMGRKVEDLFEIPGGQGVVHRVKDGIHQTL